MAEWANIQHGGNSVGTLYTDGERFGFVPVVEVADAAGAFGTVSALIKAALMADFPADDAYFSILGALDSKGDFSYEENSGETIEKPAPNTTGLDENAVASQTSPYAVLVSPDGTVTSLVQQTSDDMLVRKGGEWVEPESEVEVYGDDNSSYIYVTEESVQEYDKLVTSNKAPTLDDLEVVAPSDD